MQIEQLQKEMIAAMKAKDKPKKRCNFFSGFCSEENSN